MMFSELQGGVFSIAGVSIGMGTPLSLFLAFWPVVHLCIICWAWQCTSLIPVVERQEQVDLSEFKTALIYIVNSSQPGQGNNTARSCLRSGGKGSTRSKKWHLCATFWLHSHAWKLTKIHTHTPKLYIKSDPCSVLCCSLCVSPNKSLVWG